ncbi:MAG: hypothetical protein A4E63_02043 [Syntrophorhabdus sp. PtaU1.Bin050]|nr:MAG: hypothetical protein A4E63_02043 [Syntrophorhabdus sp. PtaU1.Bin050]
MITLRFLGSTLTAALLVLCVGTAQPAEDWDVQLSLRLLADGKEPSIEIVVENVSTNAVEITNDSNPKWSVWRWFEWKIDGKEAGYAEHVGFGPKESWRIPPKDRVLWTNFPIKLLYIRDDRGVHEGDLTDGKHHTLTILPSNQWKGLKVKAGTLEIAENKAEPPTGGDGKPAPQP